MRDEDFADEARDPPHSPVHQACERSGFRVQVESSVWWLGV